MRLDVALVERGLVRSRAQAARLIADGQVSIDTDVVRKPSTQVGPRSKLRLGTQPWVSRAAHKLIGALDESGTAVPARVLDAGASTGGFTQVCLARGAKQVYAVDVGHGQLAAEVRADPRVRVSEGLNLKDLTLSDVGEAPVDLIVGDVSFISLTLVLPATLGVLAPSGQALLLVKPQFEVGRDNLGPGGVVSDPALHRAAVERVVVVARHLGWRCDWRGISQLPGISGNREFFVRLAA
ncbi:MAG: TlyA family RNA methyltransferase [Arachnia sp.]